MIRDPSDGTVREVPKSGPAPLSSLPSGESGPPVMATVAGPDTGIRQPKKTDAIMRLEFSREWLKNYHAKKETRHADGGSNGEKHSKDGNSGNGQGEVKP